MSQRNMSMGETGNFPRASRVAETTSCSVALRAAMASKDSYMETSWSWSKAVPSQPPEAQIPSLWGRAGRRSAPRFGRGGLCPSSSADSTPTTWGLPLMETPFGWSPHMCTQITPFASWVPGSWHRPCRKSEPPTVGVVVGVTEVHPLESPRV